MRKLVVSGSERKPFIWLPQNLQRRATEDCVGEGTGVPDADGFSGGVPRVQRVPGSVQRLPLEDLPTLAPELPCPHDSRAREILNLEPNKLLGWKPVNVAQEKIKESPLKGWAIINPTLQ